MFYYIYCAINKHNVIERAWRSERSNGYLITAAVKWEVQTA